MCPIEALTSYSGPRYLLMVFAFAGDSTITNAFLDLDFAILSIYPIISWILDNASLYRQDKTFVHEPVIGDFNNIIEKSTIMIIGLKILTAYLGVFYSK